MKFKKIIILSLIALMVLGCIGTVSAGWFDFLKKETTIDINNTSNGTLYVSLNTSDGYVENKTINVEVTAYNQSQNYTVNSSSEPVSVCNLIPGEYNVSATFAGDDEYQEMYTSKMINVTELSKGAVEDAVNDLAKEINK